jgi:hypothetical protein
LQSTPEGLEKKEPFFGRIWISVRANESSYPYKQDTYALTGIMTNFTAFFAICRHIQEKGHALLTGQR